MSGLRREACRVVGWAAVACGVGRVAAWAGFEACVTAGDEGEGDERQSQVNFRTSKSGEFVSEFWCEFPLRATVTAIHR